MCEANKQVSVEQRQDESLTVTPVCHILSSSVVKWMSPAIVIHISVAPIFFFFFFYFLMYFFILFQPLQHQHNQQCETYFKKILVGPEKKKFYYYSS